MLDFAGSRVHAKEVSCETVRESSAHALFLPPVVARFVFCFSFLPSFRFPVFVSDRPLEGAFSSRRTSEGLVTARCASFASQNPSDTDSLPPGERRPSAIVVCDLRLTGVCLPARRTNNSLWIWTFCSGCAHNS